jgi:hypothetical protein
MIYLICLLRIRFSGSSGSDTLISGTKSKDTFISYKKVYEKPFTRIYIYYQIIKFIIW